MAKGQIKRSEIAESDLYKEIRDSAQKTIQQLNLMNASLKQSAEIIKKELSVGLEKTTKGIQNVTNASIQSEKIMQQSIKTEQEKLKLQKEMLKADQEIQKVEQQKEKRKQTQLKTDQEIQKVEQQKEKTKQTQLKTDQQLNREKERQEKLNEKQIKQTKDQNNAYQQLVVQTRNQKNESKRLGAELLKLEQSGRKNTAEYKKLSQQYKEVTNSAQQGDEQLKKLDKQVGDNFRNVGNYESALSGLNNAFGKLGIAFGVGQVATGIFNFNKDLDNATNTARTFFNTTQEGSKAIAKESIILGKTWGKETNEVLLSANVLSKEFGISGEEALEKINTGFNKGADVQGEFLSNIKEYSSQLTQAGLTADESISLITQSQQQGVFSDKGVDAIKEAQLSLREMTKPAQEALSAIGISGTELQNQIQSGQKTYFQAIQEISAKTNEFGIGSQQAGQILADVFKGAGEDAGKFIFSLDKLNLNLDQMDDNSQGIENAIGNLTRSFYDYIFGINETSNVTETLTDFIGFLAENLETILDVVVNVGKMFIWYKGVTLAQIGVNKILASSFLQGAKNMGVMKGATQILGNSIRQLGSFIKTNIVGIALMGIMELVREFSHLNEIAGTTSGAMNDIAESQSNLANESAKEVRQVRNLFSALRDTNPESKERLNLMNTINSKYKLTLGNYKSEVEFLNAITEAEKNLIEQIGKRTELKGKQIAFELLSEEMAKIQFEVDKSAKAIQQFYKGSFGEQALSNLFDKFGATGIGELENIFDAWQTQLDEITPLFNIARESYEKTILEMEKTGDGVEIPLFPTGDDDDDGGKKAVEKIESFMDRIKKVALKKKEIDDLLVSDIPDAQSSLDERLKTQTDSIDRELQIQTIALKQQLLNREIEQKEFDEKIIQLQIQSLEKQRELLIDYEQDVTEIDEKILDKKIELLKKQEEETEKTTKKETETIKLSSDEQIKIIESLTEAFERLADRRIEKLDEEMNKAKQRFDLYSELAKSGNINAQQSLAEEQRIIDESQRQKERLEKQKQRVQLVSSALQSYIRNTDDPDVKNPLVKTITDVSLLTQFIQSLPAFEKGIENTGTNGTGVDGRGGFLSILHPNERVLTKEQNKNVGEISNDELSNLALKYRNGELESIINVNNTKSDPESNEIVNRLKSLEQTIKNKPETNIELERIVDGALTIVRTTKKGNTKVFNRYRTEQ
jgi:hypothetical protein